MRTHLIVLAVLYFFTSSSAIVAQQGGGRPGGGAGAPGAGPAGSGGENSSFAAVAEKTEKYQSISAGGRLRPELRVDHQTPAAGFVAEVFVRQAQRVRAGQELFSVERDSTAGSFKPAVVVSRITGIVSDIFLQPEDDVGAGQKGVTVIDDAGFVLEATISDKDAFKVNIGDPVTGHTVDGKDLTGRLTGRSVEPDYGTGLFLLLFEFPENRGINIGEYVLVDLPVDRTRGIFIPREVLLRRYGKFYVWVINEEDLLELREVETGKVIENEVLIARGLSEGERYLIRLTGREKEGAPVGPPER
jgi:multidrug efflux pump subunit AcrA (membrane-fusion protein)